MAPRIRRENAPADKLLKFGWSEWHPFMVPGDIPRAKASLKGRRIKGPWLPREAGVGWRLNYFELCRLVPSSKCGIYEISADRMSKRIVVYVGSTCQCRHGRLVRRIFDYSKSGSHKSNFIDHALERGYSLSFRFKTARSKSSAEDEENKFLDRYDYAWNQRNNGSTRNIL